jgi:gliding motility-associated-like protein
MYKILITAMLTMLLCKVTIAQSLPPNFNLVINPSFGIDINSAFISNFRTFSNNSICWVTANKEIGYGFMAAHNIVQEDKFYAFDDQMCGFYQQWNPPYNYITHQYFDSTWDNRSYLQGKLHKKLEAGRTYYFSMYVGTFLNTLTHVSLNSFVSNIGVLFTNNQIIDTFNRGRIDAIPQLDFKGWRIYRNDTMTYVKVFKSFVANGGEEYLTIGNFDYFAQFDTLFAEPLAYKNSDTTKPTWSSICYDNLSLVEDTTQPIISLDHFSLGNDTAICNGQSLTIGGEPYFFHYWWSTGDTTRFITINTPGTYYCTVDYGCSTVTDTIIIAQNNKPITFTLGNDTTICTNKTLQLTAPPNYTYLWSTGEQTQQINITQASTYVCNISNACGTVKDTINIAAIQAPNTNPLIQGNTELCQNGVMVTSNLFTTSMFNLLWSTGNQANTINIKLAGTYTLKEYNTCGGHEEQVYVSGCSGILDFPNAFSPNADGVNDEFKPIIQDGRKVSKYNFIIYNRWGKQVFKSNNVQQGWDGKHAELGTYFYYCSFTENNKLQTYKGDVSLVK